VDERGMREVAIVAARVKCGACVRFASGAAAVLEQL